MFVQLTLFCEVCCNNQKIDVPFKVSVDEYISNLIQVQALWRTAYKLTKQFMHPDYKGPMRASATIKGKLEKFKINMPLINALCNPGIKKRHWEMMSKKVANLSNLTQYSNKLLNIFFHLSTYW